MYPLRTVAVPMATALLSVSAAAGEPVPVSHAIAMPATLAASLPALLQSDADAAPDSPASRGWLSGWTGSIDLGINGSDGNSDTLSIRAGLGAARETESILTKGSLTYAYAEDGGVRSKNRFEAKLINDWKLGDSPWSIFAQGAYEYDEFQAWDHRLSGFAGVGYAFIRNDRTLLRGRLGAGGAYTWNGSGEFVPEGLIGFDFTHKLTDRQSIYANGDFYPNLEDGGEFRFVFRAGWEVLVDPSANLTLKVGIEDRYDSLAAAGTKKNDIDYFALLSLAF